MHTLSPGNHPRLTVQSVKSLSEQLSAANDAADAKGSELLALQRASGDASLRLQREAAALQSALDDARTGEEAARRRAEAAESRLAASQERVAQVEADAAEMERSLGDQLRAALAQAERYQALASSEEEKRREVCVVWGWCLLQGKRV